MNSPMKRNGMMRVASQNAFVRIRSVYSRRTTAKIFFQLMRSSLDDPRLREPGLLDSGQVDLLELGFAVGKGVHFVLVESGAEKTLSVGSRRQRDHVGSVDRAGGGDAGERGDFGRARAKRHPDLSFGMLALQFLEVALEDFLRLGHQTDLVAELFRLLEHVGRENDR